MAEEIKLSGPDLARDGIPLEQLSSEIPAVGHFEGKPVVVVLGDAGPCAVEGKCTHYGGPLADGLCVAGEIRCPWHHAAFSLESGEAVGPPALNPIGVYDVAINDNRVFVTGRREEARVKPTPPLTPDSVVIVGAGAAGATAAEALRRHGYTGAVTMIGDEPPIDRPNVSKDFLAGTAPEEWMPLRSPEFYSQAGIDLLAGRRVESIDPANRLVRVDGGEDLPYGALLLAPGAEPRRLPIPGSELPHVHYLRTLEDSRSIIEALDETSSAVVIGAGFIGLEVAASLRQRDIDVTVVAPEEIPLAALIGETLGRFVAQLHREHGVQFRLGIGVNRIASDRVELEDGTSLQANLVVIGIGVTPKTQLAAAAGLKVDDGIVVNDLLRTSDANIWAAGDAASYPGPDGAQVRVEHWVQAQRQGRTAARNILGHEIAFAEPPFFWSQHYDVPINVTGHLKGWDEEVVVGDADQRDVLVAFRTAGVVTGVASIYRDRDSLRAEQALAIGDLAALANLLG